MDDSTSGAVAATLQQLAGSAQGLVPGSRQLLVGGELATNLWQRGTTFTLGSVGAYSADRWFAWGSGTLSQDASGPMNAPAGACAMQVLESVQARSLVGQLLAFSILATNVNQMMVLTGTGKDEGALAAKALLTGAPGAWAGGSVYQVNNVQSGRGEIWKQVPPGTQEIAVAVCGSAAWQLVDAQLELSAVQGQLTAVEHLPVVVDVPAQRRFAQALVEGSGYAGMGAAFTSGVCTLPLPYMRRQASLGAGLLVGSFTVVGGDGTSRALTAALVDVNGLQLAAAGTPLGPCALKGNGGNGRLVLDAEE